MVTTPLGRLNVSLATGAGLFVALVVPVLTFAAGRIAFGLEAVVDNSRRGSCGCGQCISDWCSRQHVRTQLGRAACNFSGAET